MTGATVRASFASDKPLAELAKLIELRRKVLGDDTKAACIATVINVLVSLRARTKRAKLIRRSEAEIETAPQYTPSFRSRAKNAKRLPIIRDKQGAWIRKPPASLRFVDGLAMLDQQKVFRVVPHSSYRHDREYLAVGFSTRNVSIFDALRVNKRIKRRAGLARYAFTLAMKGLGSKIPAGNPTHYVSKDAQKHVSTSISETNGRITVSASDALDYALHALKGGKTTIDLAIKKAANKTAGYLMRMTRDRGFSLHEDLPADFSTPFPELVR